MQIYYTSAADQTLESDNNYADHKTGKDQGGKTCTVANHGNRIQDIR